MFTSKARLRPTLRTQPRGRQGPRPPQLYGENGEGMRVVMRHADKDMVLAVAIALLAQAADEHHR